MLAPLIAPVPSSDSNKLIAQQHHRPPPKSPTSHVSHDSPSYSSSNERPELGEIQNWKWGPIRDDHRCGPGVGDCDGNGPRPCCSTGGFCGNTYDHCKLFVEFNFSKDTKFEHTGTRRVFHRFESCLFKVIFQKLTLF